MNTISLIESDSPGPSELRKNNGADFRLRRAVPLVLLLADYNYFLPFLGVGTVKTVCRMRPAIL